MPKKKTKILCKILKSSELNSDKVPGKFQFFSFIYLFKTNYSYICVNNHLFSFFYLFFSAESSHEKEHLAHPEMCETVSVE